MTSVFEIARPLPGACFGGTVRLAGDDGHGSDARAMIAAAEASPRALPEALAQCDGLLLLTGMQAIAEEPALLVRLSRLFGPEVEDYRQALTRFNMVHESVPEIFVVSNIPSVGRAPPPLPNPPLTADGKLPTRYPHRKGWHTDQSYRRPPRRIFRCSSPWLRCRRDRDRRCSRTAPRPMTRCRQHLGNASRGLRGCMSSPAPGARAMR